MLTKTPAPIRVAMMALALVVGGSTASQAATITWDLLVFDLTGVLSGSTYGGTVSVDDSYIGLGTLTPSNSDLGIVFDFLDEDGVTARQYTETDDSDYPTFPEFDPAGPTLDYIYVDSNSDFVWGFSHFGTFEYSFREGGEVVEAGDGSYSLTPSATSVPEPATAVLFGVGLVAVGLRRSRRKNSDRVR